jgi:acetyl esterase
MSDEATSLPDQPTPQMAAIMERLAVEDGHLQDPTLLPPATGRAQAAAGNVRWNRHLPEIAEVIDLVLPGEGGADRPGRLLRPPEAQGTILHIHGGGWAFCSLATHERAARRLALASSMDVLGIDYRLAPEHPFPAGLTDCVAAWRHLRAEASSMGLAGPFGVAGDSAGANLALALMLHEQAEGRPAPDFGLLFYGVYAPHNDTPSHRRFGPGGFGLTTAKMDRYWAWYVPDPSRRTEPLAAPLHATDEVLRRLPPLYLNAAGLDPLMSDTLLLARRLAALGRADELHIHDGVIHGFMQMTLELDEANAAFARAGRFAKRQQRR